MIIGYAIPAVQKFQGAAYKSLYYQALEISKADGATPDDNPCLIARGDELYRAGSGAVPSVLIVPQFIKPGAVYTQIPTPTLEAGDFDQFTVTRATTATRVNASGLIESVASGRLRIDYPVTGGCPAALIEPAATNLALQSEAFNDASWTKTNTTISANNAVAPDGTTTADKLIPTTTSGQHNAFRGVSVSSGNIYTFSCYVKASEYTFAALRTGDSGGAGLSIRDAIFNLSNGEVVSSTISGSASIENVGNGWYRCSLRTAQTSGAGAPGFFVFPLLTSNLNNFAGDDNSGVLFWGAQLETGSIPTSYIPTTTASASRAADVCSVSGVSGYIGQTEGTLYAEVDLRNWDTRIYAISDGSTNNVVRIETTSSKTIQTNVVVSGATQATITSNVLANGIYKIAVAYKQDDFAMYVNGSLVSSDTSGTVPACSQIFLGKRENTAVANILNDRLRAAAIYTTRLDNATLAQLTRLT